MSPVTDHNLFLSTGTAVNPDAVRSVKLAFPLSWASELGDPVGIFVITMNAERTISIGKEKASVIQKCEVGRHKGIASPALNALGVFVLSVYTAFHWCVFFPYGFTFQGQLGERFHLLV